MTGLILRRSLQRLRLLCWPRGRALAAGGLAIVLFAAGALWEWVPGLLPFGGNCLPCADFIDGINHRDS